MWYLHGPDRTTPYIDTLHEVSELHKQGLFDKSALSNYMASEVAQICELCETHGWIKPAVYQGVYNSLNRTVEAELFPCLRHHGMGYYAYNPLNGGLFTGGFFKSSVSGEGVEIRSRDVAGQNVQGEILQG